MTWTQDSATTDPGWGALAASAASWPTTGSNTTLRNASRFVAAEPTTDAEGGIDFAPSIETPNPFVITAIDPITIESPREHPVGY